MRKNVRFSEVCSYYTNVTLKKKFTTSLLATISRQSAGMIDRLINRRDLNAAEMLKTINPLQYERKIASLFRQSPWQFALKITLTVKVTKPHRYGLPHIYICRREFIDFRERTLHHCSRLKISVSLLDFLDLAIFLNNLPFVAQQYSWIR